MKNLGELVQTADGSWTLRHPDLAQDYHSSEGALFEATELYMKASGFADRLNVSGQFGSMQSLAILDVGMGLGYNACATIAAWLQSPGHGDLTLVSLESQHELLEQLFNAQAPWCVNWTDDLKAGPRALVPCSLDPSHEPAESCMTAYAVLTHPRSGKQLHWKVLIGEAQQTLPQYPFDYFWQDPFTPDLNPTMWSAAWFRQLHQVAGPGAILMTYSVSRVVKDALAAGGWTYERIATPGRKRHWLKAIPG